MALRVLAACLPGDGSSSIMSSAIWGVLGLAVGAVGAGILSKSCADKAIAELQSQSERALIESATFAISMQRIADSLREEQTKVVRIVVQDTTAAAVARRALEIAKTAQDSITLLLKENVSLKRAQLGLFEALALANARGDSLQRRGDSALAVADSLGRGIKNLKPRPQWLRNSAKIASYLVIFELGRQSVKKGKGW